MNISWIIAFFWAGLVILGWTIWFNSRMRDGEPDGSVVVLIVGFWLPATLAAYGLFSILSGHTWLIGRMLQLYEITGSGAIAMGVAWINTGLCCHFFFIWRQHRLLSRYADIAVFSTASGATGAILIAFWKVL